MTVTHILLALIALLLLVIAGGIVAIAASNPEAKRFIVKITKEVKTIGIFRIVLGLALWPIIWISEKLGKVVDFLNKVLDFLIETPLGAVQTIFKPVMKFPKIAAPLGFVGNLLAIAYIYGLAYGLGLTFLVVFLFPVLWVLFRPEISWSELPEVMHKSAAGTWDFVTHVVQWIFS